MLRILSLLLMAPLASSPAQAQAGGIQVAPVLVSIPAERGISSLRVRNGRARATAFEIDAYHWRQEDGRDVLTPSGALIVAPGVFEIPAGGEQVVRLGVRATSDGAEQSYRIVMRELPAAPGSGAVLGFMLEMSLPVFITPAGAQGRLDARIDGETLHIVNAGDAHLQLTAIESLDAGSLNGPRYLLAGGSAAISLPPRTRSIRLRAADVTGVQTERIVDVSRQGRLAPVR